MYLATFCINYHLPLDISATPYYCINYCNNILKIRRKKIPKNRELLKVTSC